MKIVFIILFFGSLSLNSSFAQSTIRISSGEWEPYMGESSPHYGLTSHIVSEAFKSEGIKVEWRFFPWKRALMMARNGEKTDASCCWWPSKEISQNFLISENVTKSSIVFFHLKSYSFDWKSMHDLEGLVIGGTFEYEYSDEFMKAANEKRIEVEWLARDELNFKKLLRGRIQIFPNDPIVGYSQIRNNFTSQEVKLFTHHPKELQSTSLNLIISKRSEDRQLFYTKFHSGLKKLKDSGRFDQMLRDVMEGKYDKQK
jgi:polar amino acid transport system substrate-binding protein